MVCAACEATLAVCPIFTPPMTPRTPSHPLLEIGIAIVVPALILMKLSDAQHLGPARALVLALAFPLGWGLYEGLRKRHLSWIAVLGLLSTLLTGGIGLLQLDAQWLAVKEAAVPGLIGLVVFASAFTRTPLIRALVYNDTVLDVQRVQRHLEERGHVQAFEARLRTGTLLVAGTFAFSAVMNYALARWIVTSPAGTEAFNEELGRLTLVSYPMIALPSMLMMAGVLYYLVHGARALTGLTLTEMLHHGEDAARQG